MTVFRKVFTLIIIGIICSILLKPFIHTYKYLGDFYGLAILASLQDEQLSYNPLSKDFTWVSPEMAASIIKNFDYPFDNCSEYSTASYISCSEPKIGFTSGLMGYHLKADDRLFEVMQFLIDKGEPIDEYDRDGYTPLQGAILSKQPRVVRLLLSSGADVHLPIKRDNKLNGKNSLEFVEILDEKNPDEFTEIKNLLYEDISEDKM